MDQTKTLLTSVCLSPSLYFRNCRLKVNFFSLFVLKLTISSYSGGPTVLLFLNFKMFVFGLSIYLLIVQALIPLTFRPSFSSSKTFVLLRLSSFNSLLLPLLISISLPCLISAPSCHLKSPDCQPKQQRGWGWEKKGEIR